MSTAVFVTFDPTTYIVTERVDASAKLILLRSGDLSGSTTVIVTPQSNSALGEYTVTPNCIVRLIVMCSYTA